MLSFNKIVYYEMHKSRFLLRKKDLGFYYEVSAVVNMVQYRNVVQVR